MIQIKEGKYYLEDFIGVVEFDLRQVSFYIGFYIENCFVFVEGIYEDGVFCVKVLGFFLVEFGQVIRSYFGSVNFFGGFFVISLKVLVKFKVVERENYNVMFVMLLDVWLDQFRVMEKLRVLFLGYLIMFLVMFILCGNFIFELYGFSYYYILKRLF